MIWSHDQLFKDHVDSVAVIDLDRDGTLETIMGCSDEGFIMLVKYGSAAVIFIVAMMAIFLT